MQSKKIIDDRNILLKAVKSDGSALKDASESLKNDRELVLEVVKRNGFALEYASSTLASDRVIILEALKSSHGDAIEYVTHLDNNKSIDDKTIIKFGKYKGFSVYEIVEFDHGYLEWVSKNVINLDSKLAAHINIVLSKQEGHNINETDVMKQYMKIEDRYSKIVNLLESKKDTVVYRGFYKGFYTLNGPLINNPDILFIGINPGAGAWKEINSQSGTNNTPLRMLGHDESFFSELDWFQNNTARGNWGKGKENKGYAWYQRDKPVNNQFPANMIDILFAIAEEKYPDIEVSTNVEPEWGNEIKSSIMVTNLYPMITDRTNQLNTLFSALKKENALKELWNTDGKKTKDWDVQKYFISTTHELVKLIKPKVIVCMGVQAYNDFTYTSFKKNKEVFSTTDNDIPVIGFKRVQNWRYLIPSIATMILMKLAERES